jgi:hypothetical protein
MCVASLITYIFWYIFTTIYIIENLYLYKDFFIKAITKAECDVELRAAMAPSQSQIPSTVGYSTCVFRTCESNIK